MAKKSSKDIGDELQAELTSETTEEEMEVVEAVGDTEEVAMLKEDVTEAREQSQALMQSIAKMQNEMVAMRRAIDNPASLGNYHDSQDYDAGVNADIGSEGLIEASAQVDPNTKCFKDKMDYEAFLHEWMTVTVEDTNEIHADPLIEISVNGKTHMFVRGMQTTCQRKFVNGLIMAKPTQFRNEEFTNEQGVRDSRQVGHTGIRYPFRVDKDVNPAGRNWLQQAIRAA